MEKEKAKQKSQAITGINLIDLLSAEDRKLQRHNAKLWWQSLTHQQKVEHVSELYDMVRQKMIQSHGVLTHAQAIRDFLNTDFPRSQEAAAQEMDQAGYVDVARSIRETRWGVDKFAIEIIDDENREMGVLEGEV